MHYKLGLSAPNPDTKDFSGKVLWNLKSFAKINWCSRGEVLLPTFLRKKSRLGLSAPNPDTKDFSRKVLWNLKSFRHNKSMYSVGNSFAYFSYKKSKCEILWHTFLIRKVCSFACFSYLFLSRRYFAKAVSVSLSL